jgi:putative spermidine/putrescine transport system substrate-binding protein
VIREETGSNRYVSGVSRRELLRVLGIAGISCGLYGCGIAKHKNLRLYGTGTLDIGSQWDRLDRDLGFTVTFKDNGNDTGPVITQMIAENAAMDYDLGGLQGGAEAELARAGKIIPWDLKKIKNWDAMWDWARSIKYTKWQGQQFGIPVVINADSMIYLPKRVGKVDSYFSVFDPKLKGKTAMEDAWINSVIFTAIYRKENALQHIVDPGDLTLDELGEVMEFLIKKKRDGQFRTFWRGWEQGLDLIAREEVWVMTGWEPIVYAARAKGVGAEYAVPKEGYEGWSNDLLLHVGAQDRGMVDAAHAFADWELGGFYGCALTKLRGYVVPSDNSIQYANLHPNEFDPGQISQTTRHVQDKFKQMKGQVYWQNVRPSNYKQYEEWWSRLQAT